jgi:hypothetical protein
MQAALMTISPWPLGIQTEMDQVRAFPIETELAMARTEVPRSAGRSFYRGSIRPTQIASSKIRLSRFELVSGMKARRVDHASRGALGAHR